MNTEKEQKELNAAAVICGAIIFGIILAITIITLILS